VIVYKYNKLIVPLLPNIMPIGYFCQPDIILSISAKEEGIASNQYGQIQKSSLIAIKTILKGYKQ
jgi:hypothetical protein